MKPRNIKELIGYVIDMLEERGIINIYAVFSGVPNALVDVGLDTYAVLLWKDGVKIRVTLKKDTLEPVAIALEV
jgi:hypothetical protein